MVNNGMFATNENSKAWPFGLDSLAVKVAASGLIFETMKKEERRIEAIQQVTGYSTPLITAVLAEENQKHLRGTVNHEVRQCYQVLEVYEQYRRN